jgi:hypothetical protein
MDWRERHETCGDGRLGRQTERSEVHLYRGRRPDVFPLSTALNIISSALLFV